jgi:hypothetical protein
MATSVSGILGKYSQAVEGKAYLYQQPYQEPEYQIMYPQYQMVPAYPSRNPPPAAPAPVQTPAPNGLALQTALGAIPIARDGDVISASYHNAIRSAVIQMAGFLGQDATNQQATIAALPAFQTEDGQTPWRLVNRVATQPTTSGNTKAAAKGWQALELPDGARVIELGAFAGRVAGSVADTFQVKLIRQKLADGTATDLGTLDLKDQTGSSFQKSLTLTGNDLDRTVDNLTYEYLVSAELANAEAKAQAKIFGIQVRCLLW